MAKIIAEAFVLGDGTSQEVGRALHKLIRWDAYWNIIKTLYLFYLRFILFCLRLVFVAYCQLALSFLLTVEIRFCLFAYGGNQFGLFTYGSPCPEIGFVLFTYGSPSVLQLGLVFSAYGSPTVSKETNRK